MKNIDIIKVTGFYVISKGDPTVGINDALWELQNDFYFDDTEELEVFRKELKSIFEQYCGDVYVETFEERSKLIDDEEKMFYSQFPVRYFICDKGYGFDTYNVTDSIHFELPNGIPENGDNKHKVIKSSEPEFNEILLKAADDLKKEIDEYENKLNTARMNLNIINSEIKHSSK